MNVKKLMEYSYIFFPLSSIVIDSLYDKSEIINIGCDDYLIKEGERSDEIYLLLKGRLEVHSQRSDEYFSVSPGDVVGEKGLFNRSIRSSSVKALCDSNLLKIKSSDFAVIYKNKGASFRVSTILAEREALNMKKRKKSRYMLLMPGHPGCDIEMVVSKLKKFCKQDINFVNFSESANFSTDELIYKILEVANTNDEKKPVLIYSNCISDNLFDIYKYFIDKLLILLDEDSVAFESQANEIFDYLKDAHLVNKIILVNHKKRELVTNTPGFLNNTDHVRYFHMCFKDDEDVERLSRFLVGRSIGLVLSGGGARGWAIYGVLLTLLSRGVRFDFICGTSIGALLGAILSLNQTFISFKEEVEKSITKANDNPLPSTEIRFPLISFFSAKSFIKGLEQTFGGIKLEHIWYPFICTSTNLSAQKQQVHDRGSLSKSLQASMAIPGLMPPLIVEGCMNVDGGVINNLPVEVLLKYLDYSGAVTAIDVSDFTEDDTFYSYKKNRTIFMQSANDDKHLRHQKIPRILSILLRSFSVGSSSLTKYSRELADVVMMPLQYKLNTVYLFSTNKGYSLEQVIEDCSMKEELSNCALLIYEVSSERWYVRILGSGLSDIKGYIDELNSLSKLNHYLSNCGFDEDMDTFMVSLVKVFEESVRGVCKKFDMRSFESRAELINIGKNYALGFVNKILSLMEEK